MGRLAFEKAWRGVVRQRGGEETGLREGEKVKRGWTETEKEEERCDEEKPTGGIYRLIDSRGFVPPSLPFPILPPFVLLSLSLFPPLVAGFPFRSLSLRPPLCAYVYARSRNTCQRLRKQNDWYISRLAALSPYLLFRSVNWFPRGGGGIAKDWARRGGWRV